MRADLNQRVTCSQLSTRPELQSQAHDLFVRRFCEDVQNFLLPYRLSHPRQPLLRFSTSCPDSLRAITQLLSVQHRTNYRYRNPGHQIASEVIEEYLRIAAYQLALVGESNWEIATISDEKEDAVGVPVLVEIPGHISKRKKMIRQYIPRSDQDRVGVSHIDLPLRMMLMIPLPAFLGSQSAHRRQLLILRDASQFMPEFATATMGGERNSKYFDLNEYTEVRYLAIAKAMSNWGWIPNQWGSERITDYYYLMRTLRFRWTLVKLREAILESVNELLTRLEIECSLSFNGLRDPESIETAIKNLEAGRIGFPEAMEATRDN